MENAKIVAEQETESLDEGRFAPRDDPSRLSVNEKVCLTLKLLNDLPRVRIRKKKEFQNPFTRV